MSRFFLFVCVLFLGFAAAAAERVTATVTVTNLAGTTNGQTFVVNGSTRTWTNVVYLSQSQVLTNTSHTRAKTNLFLHIGLSPFTQVSLLDNETNSFKLISASGVALTVTPSAGWATVSYATQTVASMVAVRVPVASEVAAQQTNIASGLVTAIGSSANTNAINEVSQFATNLVGRTNTQTIGGAKTFTSSAGLWKGSISNSPSINGTIGAVSNGLIAATALLDVNSTNLTERSQLTIGGTYLRPDPTGSGMVFIDVASGDTNIFLTNSMFVISASLGVNSGSALFNSVLTADANGFAQWNYLRAMTNSTLENASFVGTNNFFAGSDITFGRYSNTGLATGNNAGVVVGTNVFMEVSGPGAAFAINGLANGRDGKMVIIVNQTGFDMTISHQSGLDATAANRIITMTGADRTTTGNGAAILIYSGAASRWILISFDS